MISKTLCSDDSVSDIDMTAKPNSEVKCLHTQQKTADGVNCTVLQRRDSDRIQAIEGQHFANMGVIVCHSKAEWEEQHSKAGDKVRQQPRPFFLVVLMIIQGF